MDTSSEALSVPLCKSAENIRYKRHTDQKAAAEPEILMVLRIKFDVLKMWLYISVFYQIVTNCRQIF
jgi:hypothetical protein